MSTEKARVAMINLGVEKIEGLMLPDSSFAIAVSQLSNFIKRRVGL